MTDCSLVRQELKSLLKLTDEDIINYDSLILCAVNWVKSLIKQEQNENDALIVHLCTVKAYYQISLIQNDGISSFSAGEISFSADNNSFTGAKKMLEDALSSCSHLITDSSFAFKAV